MGEIHRLVVNSFYNQQLVDRQVIRFELSL